MKHLILMAGLPGSGKTTEAQLGVEMQPDTTILSMDDLSTDENGKYVFDPSLKYSIVEMFLGFVLTALHEGWPNIIIDNTNASLSVRESLTNMAEDLGYRVTLFFVSTTLTDDELALRNVHGVPATDIAKMRAKFVEQGLM